MAAQDRRNSPSEQHPAGPHRSQPARQPPVTQAISQHHTQPAPEQQLSISCTSSSSSSGTVTQLNAQQALKPPSQSSPHSKPVRTRPAHLAISPQRKAGQHPATEPSSRNSATSGSEGHKAESADLQQPFSQAASTTAAATSITAGPYQPAQGISSSAQHRHTSTPCPTAAQPTAGPASRHEPVFSMTRQSPARRQLRQHANTVPSSQPQTDQSAPSTSNSLRAKAPRPECHKQVSSKQPQPQRQPRQPALQGRLLPARPQSAQTQDLHPGSASRRTQTPDPQSNPASTSTSHKRIPQLQQSASTMQAYEQAEQVQLNQAETRASPLQLP